MSDAEAAFYQEFRQAINDARAWRDLQQQSNPAMRVDMERQLHKTVERLSRTDESIRREAMRANGYSEAERQSLGRAIEQYRNDPANRPGRSWTAPREWEHRPMTRDERLRREEEIRVIEAQNRNKPPGGGDGQDKKQDRPGLREEIKQEIEKRIMRYVPDPPRQRQGRGQCR